MRHALLPLLLLFGLASGVARSRTAAESDTLTVRRVVPDTLAEKGRDALADSIMERVFSYTFRTGLRLTDFRSDVYVRHHLRTKRRGVIMRYLPGWFRLERGENEYLGESFAHYDFRLPASVDRKYVADYSTMPYRSSDDDVWIGRFAPSIYEEGLFTDRILSPLNRRNRRYYRYRADGSYVIGGRKFVTVRVTPSFHNTQLVQGFFDVDAVSGAVRLFSFEFFYDWTRLHVSGEMGTSGQGTLLPSRIRVGSRLRLLGNRVDETYDATSTYRFQPSVPSDSGLRKYDLTDRCRLRTDTTSCQRSRAVFDELRPYPLLPRQAAIYHRHDSLRTSRTDTLRPSRRHWFSPEAEDVLFDSHQIYLGRQTNLRLPPILTPAMVQWSGSRGLSLQTRISLTYHFFNRIALEYRPRVGYNFKERQVYWRSPLTIAVMPRYDGLFRFEAAGGDRMYNSAQADELRDRLQGVGGYDSLQSVLRSHELNYYRDTHAKAEFAMQPFPGLQLSLGTRFHLRRLIGWNELAEKGGFHRTLFSVAPRLHVEYTPALYYYRRGDGRSVPLHSVWPTFMLDYERGISDRDRQVRYERFEADARYRLPLHALRAFYLRLGCGFYTLRERNSFLDYDYFRNYYLPESWDDEMAGRFQLLDSRWYNESRYYVRMATAYESPMLLLSRVKFLTRVVQKERVYANLLSVGRLGFYSEWGYGIATPLVDAAAFVSLARRGQMGFGCKVLLSL